MNSPTKSTKIQVYFINFSNFLLTTQIFDDIKLYFQFNLTFYTKMSMTLNTFTKHWKVNINLNYL